MIVKYFIITFLIICLGCSNQFHIVYPVLETAPVKNQDDAADDIAIFIDTANDQQIIYGTNKQSGIVAYKNTGSILEDYPVGRINNVDLRQDIPWNNHMISILGGSNRTDNSIVLYRIDESYKLIPLHDDPIESSVDEVYGFCMYKDKEGQSYAFVVGKDGVVEQWEISPNYDQAKATLVRTFDVGGQCEGMVADDLTGDLYIGEEDVGVWKYHAKPDADETRISIVKIDELKNLKADVEGLTIYRSFDSDEALLIVSSQGNNSYALFDINSDHNYVGSFKIKSNGSIGGVSETDGIDVTAYPFEKFSDGVFIAQDGHNGRKNQNFKIVDLQSIKSLIKN